MRSTDLSERILTGFLTNLGTAEPLPERMQAVGERVLQNLKSSSSSEASEFSVPGRPAVRSDTNTVWRREWSAAVVRAALALAFVATAYLIVSRSNSTTWVAKAADGTTYGTAKTFRSLDQNGTVMKLADGSRVEMRPGAEGSVDRTGDGLEFHLKTGSIIENAAKQAAGRHLHVKTKDVNISVVGTVVLVSAKEEGSRVAVVEGEVRVQQGAATKKLISGEQLSTNPAMRPLPAKKEIEWRPNAEVHLALLQQASSANATTFTFEVASVRKDVPIGPGNIPGGGAPECRGIDGRFGSTEEQSAPLGRCTGRHVSLMWLIDAAYDLNGEAWRHVVGLEPWMRDLWKEGFQINAKTADPSHTTIAQLKQMLQGLLADRCKLQVTREKREVSQLALMVAPRGAKLQSAAREGTVSSRTRRIPAGTEIRITGNGSMKAFVAALQPISAIDRTEASGTYSFNFSYLIPSDPAGNRGGNPQRGGGGGGAAADKWLPALRDALEDQLGLRLESINVPTDFIIIEHAERLSDN